ncbi:LOW QUALITY PROTEIN: leukotriene A-4 hydrolase-like [Menidia menidia]
MSDPCSLSSLSSCLTRHLNLELRVDFPRRVLSGKVQLTLEALEDQLSALTLDSRDLQVSSVKADRQEARFSLGPPHRSKGAPLHVTLPFHLSRGQQVVLEVDYETSPGASALQWLSAPQTAGRKQPYLFSQCQAHHCRSMIPCQDSPSIKHTYYAKTEAMLQTAEAWRGPYVWGQYDILLPPSFPYGGMENPCLTFATPTLLAGDRSLSNVIAHEISHSWTGNLVTNKTWEHFWLNEGHTVYLERMIGRCMQGEESPQFKARGGWKELQDSVDTFGADSPLTLLVPSLKDVDPDDAFSSVPYEKGFALLYHLEELLGGPEVFMGFVKSYIQLFAYGSVTTEQWKKHLFCYFKDQVDVLKVDWHAWMCSPGMPPVQPQYDSTLADACIALTQKWTQAKDQDLEGFKGADLKTLSSHQIIEFLSLLLQEDPLPLTHVKKMQEVYDLNASTNSEIRFRWLRLCVRSRWEEAVPLALKMATEQGRMKFTRPLFREVYSFSRFQQEAVRVFLAHRDQMHPVTAGLVAKALKVDQ